MSIHFSLLTLFPELLRPFTQEAILGKAAAKGLLSFEIIDLRDFAGNKHNKVDDTPYGGGAGMLIRVDVVERALISLKQRHSPPDEIILLTPAGERFEQPLAQQLSQRRHLAILCGRYEGFDARVEQLVTREISIGDFVMMGGEAAAACLLEAIGRLPEGVLGDSQSHQQDSFSGSGLLDYPEYTRPAIWQPSTLPPNPADPNTAQPAALGIPPVLTSGHHAQIATWRRSKALQRTLQRRPDLLSSANLSAQDSADLLAWGVSQQQLSDWGAPPAPTKKRPKK